MEFLGVEFLSTSFFKILIISSIYINLCLEIKKIFKSILYTFRTSGLELYSSISYQNKIYNKQNRFTIKQLIILFAFITINLIMNILSSKIEFSHFYKVIQCIIIFLMGIYIIYLKTFPTNNKLNNQRKILRKNYTGNLEILELMLGSMLAAIVSCNIHPKYTFIFIFIYMFRSILLILLSKLINRSVKKFIPDLDIESINYNEINIDNIKSSMVSSSQIGKKINEKVFNLIFVNTKSENNRLGFNYLNQKHENMKILNLCRIEVRIFLIFIDGIYYLFDRSYIIITSIIIISQLKKFISLFIIFAMINILVNVYKKYFGQRNITLKSMIIYSLIILSITIIFTINTK